MNSSRRTSRSTPATCDRAARLRCPFSAADARRLSTSRLLIYRREVWGQDVSGLLVCTIGGGSSHDLGFQLRGPQISGPSSNCGVQALLCADGVPVPGRSRSLAQSVSGFQPPLQLVPSSRKLGSLLSLRILRSPDADRRHRSHLDSQSPRLVCSPPAPEGLAERANQASKSSRSAGDRAHGIFGDV